MKQKIEWYREVLALEPGSRVFFPLARLLASDGQLPVAISTLQQGIVHHPDHVEARLLLIEFLLLAGNQTAAEGEASELGRLFSAYPAFWGAWSNILSAKPGMRDAALAMRVVGLALQGKTISWGAIMEQGLAALTGAALPPVVHGAHSHHGAAAHEAAHAYAASAAPKVPSHPARVAEVHEAPAPHVVHDAPQTPAVEAALDSTLDLGDGFEADSDLVFDEQQHQPEAPAAVAAPASELPVFEDGSGAFAPVPEKQISAGHDLAPALEEGGDEGDEEGEEEPFSIRTRSMAEVLAEQGDFAGAAEIYGELATHAPEAEKGELLERMTELQGRSAAVPAGQEADSASTGHSSKLADLLESLAQRLENRAH
ncbi:hypothetical protein [Desulfovibrio cuneatus]|uniref:hypothetical protein n=1 Tax=Desulfovibrio cuneatus TaxID=159728 RepID=UPI0003FB8726|nr:hypothetical protein [Desulfovibrio cuneatus]